MKFLMFVLALLIAGSAFGQVFPAPASLTGRTVIVIITRGSGAYASSGAYSMNFGATRYTVSQIAGPVSSSNGTYTYSRPLNGDKALVTANDSVTGSVTVNLSFKTASTAYFSIFNTNGSQFGEAIIDGVTGVLPTYPITSLINISVRAQVPANGRIIPGFVLESGARVLIRAVGPTLGSFGVPGTLADPKLTVFDAASVAIASNDDWGSTTDNQAAVSDAGLKSGAFPLAAGSKDSAVVLDLAAGNYTCAISGVADSSGEVLLEVYRVIK